MFFSVTMPIDILESLLTARKPRIPHGGYGHCPDRYPVIVVVILDYIDHVTSTGNIVRFPATLWTTAIYWLAYFCADVGEVVTK